MVGPVEFCKVNLELELLAISFSFIWTQISNPLLEDVYLVSSQNNSSIPWHLHVFIGKVCYLKRLHAPSPLGDCFILPGLPEQLTMCPL